MNLTCWARDGQSKVRFLKLIAGFGRWVKVSEFISFQKSQNGGRKGIGLASHSWTSKLKSQYWQNFLTAIERIDDLATLYNAKPTLWVINSCL